MRMSYGTYLPNKAALISVVYLVPMDGCRDSLAAWRASQRVAVWYSVLWDRGSADGIICAVRV